MERNRKHISTYHNLMMRFWIGVAAISALFVSSCEFREPVAPKWDVQLTVPLVNHVYTVDSLLKKNSDLIAVNPTNGSLTYSYTENAGSEKLGDKVQLAANQPNPLHISAGSIPLPTSVGGSVAILNPGFSSGVIPPGQFMTAAGSFPTSDAIQYVTFNTGTLSLQVTNLLPIQVDFGNSVTIRDNANNIFGPFSIGMLDPGQTSASSVALDGQTMYAALSLDTVQISTPGSGGSSVILPSTFFLSALQFSNLDVQSASAKFYSTPLMRTDNNQLVVDGSSQPNMISMATFKRGSFELHVRNNFDVSTRVNLKVSQLFDRLTGKQIDETRLINRHDSIVVPVNLVNDSISSPTPTNIVEYSAAILDLGSDIDTATYHIVNATDVIDVQLYLADGGKESFVLKAAAGVLKPTTLAIDTTFNLDLGTLPFAFDLDSIQMPDATVELLLQTPNLPANVFGRLRVTDSPTGNYVDVNVPLTSLPSNKITPITIGGNNFISQLAQLISSTKRFPDKVHFIGNAIVNPDYVEGSVADTTSIEGTIRFNIPLNVGLKNALVRDTIELNMQVNDIDKIQSGQTSFQISNGLPSSASVSVQLLDTQRNPMRTIPSTPLSLLASQIGVDGFASMATTTRTAIQLTRDDITALVNAKYAVLILQLDTPPSAPSVRFRNTDGIQLSISSSLNYRMDGGK